MSTYVGNKWVCIQLQVEAGDVLLKVNGTDVNRFSTREGEESAIYHANATYLVYARLPILPEPVTYV